MSETFRNMARIVIRDAAAREEAVAEKTVLLKEVHHRVKNNLQLIASIINMQSRVIDDTDAKRVLRSVQDRVASLATIYKNLYQAEHLESVEADRLIRDIIGQMSTASVVNDQSIQVDTQLEPLVLLPDQAVPLTLLTTEAFTNALKYAGASDGALGLLAEQTPGLRTALGWRSLTALISASKVRTFLPRRVATGQFAHVPIQLGAVPIFADRLIVRAHRLGVRVVVWTVDEPDLMHRLLDAGVDGIITDRPDILRAVMIERGVWSPMGGRDSAAVPG